MDDAETIARFNSNMAMETEGKALEWDSVFPGVQAAIADPTKGHYYLAEIDGSVVGQAMITFEWSDWRNAYCWWIQSVYVVPEGRRKGMFRALYAKAEEEARAAGAVKLRLYVKLENNGAQSTYESLGMKKSQYQMYEANL